VCGINGFNRKDKDLIEIMNTALHNRGPDDKGVYIDHLVSLGHTRLSIIDLSPMGHQPMTNEDGSIWLTYNGEIYNFQELRNDLESKGHLFISHTDSEVIIHAYEEYGLDCLNRFNGMWAFCLYDMAKQELILSRDQFGIKPLYYFFDEEQFIFSSMITGILCHDICTSPNEKIIMDHLAFNLQDHTQQTFFKNILTLQPDKVLVYDLKKKKLEMIQWFYLDKTIKKQSSEEIKQMFIRSVELRTISDVPVGSCLSGGIDSSAIVSILDGKLPSQFNTYSYLATGSPLDESKYIEEVGKNTNTRQCFTKLNEDDFLEEIDDFVVSIEEPVSGLSPYAQYRVMKLAGQDGAKVLLDGQGGDELYAGYEYYFSYYFYELLSTYKFLQLIKEMYLYLRNFRKTYAVLMFCFLLLPGCLKRITWKNILCRWLDHNYFNLGQKHSSYDPRWQRMKLQDALTYTFFYSAIPHLLKWEDKNSMRWSVESRVPFFDQDLVTASLYLSPSQKINNGRTKVIFKDALDDCLLKIIKERKDKVGFGTVVDDFIRREKVQTFFSKIINSESFKNRPYWNWKVVNRDFKRHLNGSKNIGDTIWKWVNIELWLRQFFPLGSDCQEKELST
jgi:asparagine synthase (glutamine-hydrolysing)